MKNLKYNKYWQCPHCDGIQKKPSQQTEKSLSSCQICKKKTADSPIMAGQYDISTKNIDIDKWNQSKLITNGTEVRNARIAYMALAGFLLVSLLLYLQFMKAADSIVCAHPEYQQLRIGMSSTEVIKLMGEPKNKNASDSENAIEVWSYQFPNWKGDIELIFNKNQVLARQNCQ